MNSWELSLATTMTNRTPVDLFRKGGRPVTRIIRCGALLAFAGLPLRASAADQASKLPPQPHEWLAPSVDMSPPAAEARWSTVWTQSRSLPVPLAGHRAVAVGNHLLVIGGVTQREHIGSRDVYVTTVEKNGALGPWKKSKPLPAPTAFFDLVAANGRIYVIGGSSREGMQNIYDTVLSAAVKKDGSVDAWRQERALPSHLVYPAATAVGGYLYVLGGFDGAEYHQNMSYAKLNADGSLGEWKDARAMYPHKVGRTYLASVNGDLVVVGGLWSDSQGEHISSLIQRAKRDEDGNVREWLGEHGLKIASRSMRFSLAEEAGVSDGNFLYVLGGRDPDSLGVPTTQASWINPKTNEISRWLFGPELPLYGVKGAPQPARVYQTAAVIVGDRMFVLGGFLFVRELTPLVWSMPLKPYAEPAWLKPRS